ncbi:hypothetical protein HDE_11273 [Halotydeus destructor]|nr:hypothetical protein HDE_11273 [Halotydeus destructor]
MYQEALDSIAALQGLILSVITNCRELKQELVAAEEQAAKLTRENKSLKKEKKKDGKDKMADNPVVDSNTASDDTIASTASGPGAPTSFAGTSGYFAQNGHSPWDLVGSPMDYSNMTASMPSASGRSTVTMNSLPQENVPQAQAPAPPPQANGRRGRASVGKSPSSR